MSDPLAGCAGVEPLRGRLEAWQLEIAANPARLAALIAEHGSPVNLLNPAPMARNVEGLREVAWEHGLELEVFFARKANKGLCFVERALELGAGVDVASQNELRQALECGFVPAQLIVTAAVKPRPLLELCVDAGVTVAIDNEDELDQLTACAQPEEPTPIAMRLAPQGGTTRFGMSAVGILDLVDRGRIDPFELVGIHFHLDGYLPGDRVAAFAEAIWLVDRLAERGRPIRFLDMGGGIPMSYLDSAAEWESFWGAHQDGLLGRRAPLTFDGHGLGLRVDHGRVRGSRAVYPFRQAPVGGAWIEEILSAPLPDAEADSVATALAERGLGLHCEPGRSLLDGCGATAARVEFRKQRADGTWLIGLAMNRTQCRSTSDDFLVDPLLVRPDSAGEPTEPIEGYLVGAYCIERELITWRRLRFPNGVAVGDLIMFVNTAGYQMHILESASHQIPLARNLVVGPGEIALDPIEGHR
jgi:diaminopimelate decarboxylase